MLSKRDLLPDAEVEAAAAAWASGSATAALGVLAVSSATGEGLDELRRRILAELSRRCAGRGAGRRTRRAASSRPSTASTGPPARAATGSSARRRAPTGSRGRGVELLFERHDLKNDEALAYLEQRLGEMGVLAALRDAGFEPGDEVRDRRARVRAIPR